MVSSGDFNFTRILDEGINNPIETAEVVSDAFATEGNAISGFLIFVIFILLILLAIGVAIGGVWFILTFIKK